MSYHLSCSFSGNTINIVSGKWVSAMSGIGAGMDSLYEYLLKVNVSLLLIQIKLKMVLTILVWFSIVGLHCFW